MACSLETRRMSESFSEARHAISVSGVTLSPLPNSSITASARENLHASAVPASARSLRLNNSSAFSSAESLRFSVIPFPFDSLVCILSLGKTRHLRKWWGGGATRLAVLLLRAFLPTLPDGEADSLRAAPSGLFIQ